MIESIKKRDKIAIVIPVHNRRELTLACLRRLEEIKKNGFEDTVIVVDDGSTDRTSDAIKESYPNVIVLHGDGNLWWTGAINKGVNYAIANGFDYILTLNDDIDFKKDFLQILFDTSKKYPKSIVSSISLMYNASTNEEIIVSAGNKISGWLRHFIPVIDNQMTSGLAEEIIYCDAMAGRSLLIPVNVFREVGIFDASSFPHGHGDIEFTYRAKLAGFSLIVNTKSKIYTDLNINHFPVFLVNSGRLDFIKNMFNIKFGYGFKLTYSLAFMHKPLLIGVVDFSYKMLRLFKWVLIKLCMPRSYLKAFISKKIDMTLYGPFIN